MGQAQGGALMGVSSGGLSPGSSPQRPWAHHFCFGAIFILLVYKTGGCIRSVFSKCGPRSGLGVSVLPAKDLAPPSSRGISNSGVGRALWVILLQDLESRWVG